MRATMDNFRHGTDGLPRVTDPNGLSVAFRVSNGRLMWSSQHRPNAPGSHQPYQRRSPIHERAIRSISATSLFLCGTSQPCARSIPKSSAS